MTDIDYSVPQEGFVFPLDKDFTGARLALVFGNEAGICPYYSRQCLFCEIGAGEYDGHLFTSDENIRRTGWFVSYYGESVLRTVKHLLLYNSGSVLAAGQLSDQTLAHIVKKLFCYCKPVKVSLDTRSCFITEEKLRFLGTIFSGVEHIQFDIGLETFNEKVRREKLKKLICLPEIEDVCERMKQPESSPQFGLAINLVYGLPCWSIAEALADIEQGVNYFHSLAHRYGISINFNIHPFQPNRKSEIYFPGSSGPQENEIVRLLDLLEKISLKLGDYHHFYIGMNDEGLSIENEGHVTAGLLDKVKKFNIKGGV